MRFTIRDLLWLTVVVALGVAWWLERGSSQRLRDVAAESLDWRSFSGKVVVGIEQIEEQVREYGLTVDWGPAGPVVKPDVSNASASAVKMERPMTEPQ